MSELECAVLLHRRTQNMPACRQSCQRRSSLLRVALILLDCSRPGSAVCLDVALHLTYRLRDPGAEGAGRLASVSYNVTLEHVERERNYCSVAHELKVPFTAVDANCSKWSRARESRLVRLSKECKHEQHGRRVDAISPQTEDKIGRAHV